MHARSNELFSPSKVMFVSRNIASGSSAVMMGVTQENVQPWLGPTELSA